MIASPSLRRLAGIVVLGALAMGCKVQADPKDLARCGEPSAELVSTISEKLTKGAEYSLRNPYVVVSESTGWTWFSAEYAHEDDRPKDFADIVTFGSKTPDDPASWVAAEERAVDSSSWPDGREQGIEIRDDGLVASRGCSANDRPKGPLD